VDKVHRFAELIAAADIKFSSVIPVKTKEMVEILFQHQVE